MAYVPVPKDLTKIKTKIAFNLSKRQIICFGSGVLIGIPLFFLFRQHLSASAATLLMVIAMMPCFLLAMYEKNGQPLEKFIRHIIMQKLIRPAQRPYRTNNFYAALERQIRLESEVKAIVRKGKTKEKRKP